MLGDKVQGDIFKGGVSGTPGMVVAVTVFSDFHQLFTHSRRFI